MLYLGLIVTSRICLGFGFLSVTVLYLHHSFLEEGLKAFSRPITVPTTNICYSLTCVAGRGRKGRRRGRESRQGGRRGLAPVLQDSNMHGLGKQEGRRHGESRAEEG